MLLAETRRALKRMWKRYNLETQEVYEVEKRELEREEFSEKQNTGGGWNLFLKIPYGILQKSMLKRITE
jgi:hypothetical protein